MIVCSKCSEKYDRDPIDGRCELCRYPTVLIQDEKNVTEFFLPMIPPTTTHQQKQVAVVNSKPVFYEPEDLKAARAKLMAHLGQHVPNRKFVGPIRLIAKWCFPLIDGKVDGQFKDTKPDNGNSNKLLEDCMEDLGFFNRGDQQIASLIVEHFWAATPGIYIRIEEL